MTIDQAKAIFEALGLSVSLFEKSVRPDGGDAIYEAAFSGVEQLSVAIDSLHNIYFQHGGLDRVLVWSAKPSEGREWADVGTAKYKPSELVSFCMEVLKYNKEELLKVTKGIL